MVIVRHLHVADQGQDKCLGHLRLTVAQALIMNWLYDVGWSQWVS